MLTPWPNTAVDTILCKFQSIEHIQCFKKITFDHLHPRAAHKIHLPHFPTCLCFPNSGACSPSDSPEICAQWFPGQSPSFPSTLYLTFHRCTYYLPLLNMAFQIPYFLTNYTLKGRSHWSTFAILTTLLFCLLFISISYTWQYLAVKWTTAVFQHRSAPHIKDMHNTCIIPSTLKKEKNKRSIR